MSDPNLGKLSQNERQFFLVEFLRRRAPVKTAETVADETGIAVETVRGWLNKGGRPGFAHLIALIGAYGPEFLVATMPDCPAWLDEAHAAEQARALDRQFQQLAAKRAALGERLGMAGFSSRDAAGDSADLDRGGEARLDAGGLGV
jgi:hypothetical protein